MNLRRLLSQRVENRWELLATAVGVEAAVASTMAGLSATALSKGAFGRADAPSMVRLRVEALAAYNVELLQELAQTWIDPRNIREHPWWEAAWYVSLRHLKQQGVIQRAQVDVPELSWEVTVLWDTPEERHASWHAIKTELAQRFNPRAYDLLRKQAACDLVEQHLSEADIRTAPLEMLRLLRGRAALLDASARAFLTGVAQDRAHPDQLNPLVIELCQELALPAVPEAAAIQAIGHTADPESIAPAIYTLLGTWRVP